MNDGTLHHIIRWNLENPAYGGRKSTLVQPPSSLHPLSVRGADNPSSRYQSPWFCLSTCGNVGPYKGRNGLLSEPIHCFSQG